MDVLTNTCASNRYIGEIWALVCRSMAMCVRTMLLCSFIVAFVALVDVPEASAQEKYAGVALQPNGWIMRQMKTFSGSAPSRAWIFGRKKNVAAERRGIDDDAQTRRMPGMDLDRTKHDNGGDRAKSGQLGDADAEVFASILVTEGIVGGVRPQKQSALLKLYVESMIQAWGGTSRDDGMTTDEILDDDSGREMARRAGILIAAGNSAQADGLGHAGNSGNGADAGHAGNSAQADDLGQTGNSGSGADLGQAGESDERNGNDSRFDASNVVAFCGRNASYRVGVSFGALSYTYYGCMVTRKDLFRMVFLVTWMPEADDALARERLEAFLEGVGFGN